MIYAQQKNYVNNMQKQNLQESRSLQYENRLVVHCKFYIQYAQIYPQHMPSLIYV